MNEYFFGPLMEHGLQNEINLLHARVCHALADSKRILLLYALASKPHRVVDLMELLEVSQPTVSHHLKVLREQGLVAGRREGNETYYYLQDKRVIEALDLLRAVLRDMLIRQASLVQHIGDAGSEA